VQVAHAVLPAEAVEEHESGATAEARREHLAVVEYAPMDEISVMREAQFMLFRGLLPVGWQPPRR